MFLCLAWVVGHALYGKKLRLLELGVKREIV